MGTARPPRVEQARVAAPTRPPRWPSWRRSAILALVIVPDPRRIGVFPDQPGRSAAPGERGLGVRDPGAGRPDRGRRRGPPRGGSGSRAASTPRDDAVDRVLVYDPVGDGWAEGPPLPEPVHHAALVSDGDALFLIGGYAGDGFGRPTAAVWRLDDTDGGPWTPDQPLPEPRGAGAAAWNGRGGIMYGGGVGPSGVSDDVFVLEDDELASVGVAEPAARAPCRVLARAPDPSRSSVAAMRRAISGRSISCRRRASSAAPEDLPTARGGIAAFSAGELGDCVVGGEGPNGTFGAVECVGAFETTTLPGLAVPRHGLGAAFVDGRAYVLLGGRQPGLTVSDVVEVLDLR